MSDRSVRLPPQRAFGLPAVLTLGLVAFGLLDSVRQNPMLWWSFLGAGIDRAARSKMLQAFDPTSLGRSLAPRQRNLAYMSI